MLALVAAIGNAVYWASAASVTHGLPPVTLAGMGLAVGGVLLGLATLVGVLPFRVSVSGAELAGRAWPMPIMIGALIMIATVVPYVTGIAGARRLGATLASFAGYSEPIFAIVWMGLLLSLLPSAVQFVGAAAIVTGVVLVRLGQLHEERRDRQYVDHDVALI